METIDLALDSDEEGPLVIAEDQDPCVDVKQKVNHNVKIMTERLHNILDRHLKELENNVHGSYIENTDENERFVNPSEDNSIDYTKVISLEINNKLLMMNDDIQKQLKYIKKQENKMNSLLASIPANNVLRPSLEWRTRNTCQRLRQELIQHLKAIPQREKESINACFGSETYATNVIEVKSNQNNNEVVVQEPSVAVHDNRSEGHCNENNNRTMLGITSITESGNLIKNGNGNLTVGNRRKFIGTTSAEDDANRDVNIGRAVSVFQQLEPKNMRARIIFEDDDEDDDDFYFGLDDSNSGEAGDISDCINPHVSSQKKTTSSKKMLLDTYNVEQVAYVKELVKESNEELVSFKNIFKSEQKQLTSQESIKETVNDKHVQEGKCEIIQGVNQVIAIRRMSSRDYTTKMKNVNNYEPKSCTDVNVVEKKENKPDKEKAVNLRLHATTQNENAQDTEIISAKKDRNKQSESEDIEPSNNMDQIIGNHIQLEHVQCFIMQEQKDDFEKTCRSEPNSDQSVPNISDSVQNVVVGSSLVNKPRTSDSDTCKIVPIQLKLDNITDIVSTASKHGSGVDLSETKTENNDLKRDSVEPEVGNSNIDARLNYAEGSLPAATACSVINDISDSEHSDEMSSEEDNPHEEEIGEWHFGN